MTRQTGWLPAFALAAFTLTLAPAAQAGDSCTATKDAAKSGSVAADAPAKPAPTIVETAQAAGTFQTLVAAVEAAGLAETLSGPGPFTVFAPTDEAFAKLPAGTVEGLLKDIPALTNILTFHVLSGQVMAGDLKDGLTAPTIQGGDLIFDLTEDAKVNGIRIVTTDIQCSNGVIHVIDSVLLP